MPFPHLPKPIYEALPVIYVLGGVSASFWSDGAVGVLSGIALAVAGIQVHLLRRRHRKLNEQQDKLTEARLHRHRQSKLG